MPSGPLGLMRRLIGRPRLADLGDGDLLEKFVAGGDMPAFEALVQRYGPLVLGVCRRVLQDEHDAEDAFQATFLVFARRAATIRSQGAVGSWLAGTAYRISLKARAANVRRRVQEKAAGTQLTSDSETEAVWEELRGVLDEELQQLPEKYRVPLVLCYLEGKTNEAAAREMGWAPGSMSYRLAQARERLRERLMHRGVGLAPALLVPALVAHALASVPVALSGVTAKAALLYATGQEVIGMVSPQALALAEGVLRTVDMLRAIFATLFVVLLVLTAGASGLLLLQGDGDRQAAADNAPGVPVPVKPLDEDNHITVTFSPDTSRFGIACAKLRDPQYPKRPKLLTRSDNGHTNNTIVRIDGFPYVFGREVPSARYFRDKTGKFWKEVQDRDNPRQWTTIMDWRNERVRVTQTVEIVVGEQTHLYDTALVKYVIQNLDDKVHTIGLRLMLDTYIGANDGVPFLAPPSEAAPSGQLIDTMAVFEKDRIPEFLRALESGDLNDKNATVAELGLKLKGCEPLQQLVICRWPQEQGASEARWDWKYEPMNIRPNDLDSCVLLYWNKMDLNPEEKRTLGFTYGLGRIADGMGTAPMRLLAGGPMRTGGTFVVTLYVKGTAGDKVRLHLPEGLRFAEGQKEQQVIDGPMERGYAQVSWRVTAAKVGNYTVRASVDGRDTTLDLHVRERSIFD